MKYRRRFGLIVLFCLFPVQQLLADVAPESLLPADTAVYLRLSSWSDLRQAYNGTALSEVMRGDLGRCLATLTDFGRKCAQEALKKGVPNDPRLIEKFWANLDRSGQQIMQHGALLGVQLPTETEYQAEQATAVFTLVFPNGSKGGMGPVQKFLEDGAEAWKGNRSLNTFKTGMRTVAFIDFEESGSWAWWSDEGHFVVACSMEPAKTLLKRLQKRPSGNLTQNVLYQKLAASQTYPTLLSGFIDSRPIFDLCLPRSTDDETDKGRSALEELGILDMQGLTFRCGFEGKAWRESYALHLDPQRRGIWQVLEATDNVNVDQLPALPADATSVFVGAINTGRLTNVVGKWIDTFPADSMTKEQAVLAKDIMKQVLAPLGPQLVWFNSPGEGGFMLDQTVAIQVKDAAALNDLIRLLEVGQKFKGLLGDEAQNFMGGYTLKKHSYRGVDYWTAESLSEGSVLVPSFVVHEGWLVLACNPQAVQGYILRTRKEAPCWQPAPELRRALSGLVKEQENLSSTEAQVQCVFGFDGFMPQRCREWIMGDPTPRPLRILAVNQLDTRELTRCGLSFGPWLGFYAQMANASLKESGVGVTLDPTLIPNTHAVVGPLFPNVNLLADDGRALRWEKHASLPIGHVVTSYLAIAGVVMGKESYPNLSPWIPAPREPQDKVVAKPSSKPFGPTKIPGWDSPPIYAPAVPYPQPADSAGVLPPPSPSSDGPSFTPLSPYSQGFQQPVTPENGQQPLSRMIALGTKDVVRTSSEGPAGKETRIPDVVAKTSEAAEMIVKVYDIAGLLDPKNLERSKAELQDTLYLVAPKSWDEGREPGTLPMVILTAQQRIVVRQTAEVHRRIERLLGELKASLPKDLGARETLNSPR